MIIKNPPRCDAMTFTELVRSIEHSTKGENKMEEPYQPSSLNINIGEGMNDKVKELIKKSSSSLTLDELMEIVKEKISEGKLKERDVVSAFKLKVIRLETINGRDIPYSICIEG